MNLEIDEIIREYQITIPINNKLTRIKGRILRKYDTSNYYYVTNLLYKSIDGADFYTPGAGALSLGDAEGKMYEYLKKIENVLNDGGKTIENELYW